ncbi:DUF4870 domain-containing protein [Actinoplanes sp. DH11]|uniref:DUF4870 domain-containing protein n=1 Tax=Actinoplanes sp. DH11 TaxID=2857011 RepID=UPI001E2DF326|nr:DUF4870 domain-containing protein [Actinoplanes sp. DH11]
MTEPPRPPEGGGDPYQQVPPPYDNQQGYPPPGYPPPGYPPPGHQPPPGYGYGYQPGPSSADDRTWIVLTHLIAALVAFLSSGLLGWVMPLISLLAQGSRSPVVRAHAVQALNFQILWSVITLVGYITACILVGWVLVFVGWLVAWIVPLIAGIKATNNQPYRYPMNMNMIK